MHFQSSKNLHGIGIRVKSSWQIFQIATLFTSPACQLRFRQCSSFAWIDMWTAPVCFFLKVFPFFLFNFGNLEMFAFATLGFLQAAIRAKTLQSPTTRVGKAPHLSSLSNSVSAANAQWFEDLQAFCWFLQSATQKTAHISQALLVGFKFEFLFGASAA